MSKSNKAPRMSKSNKAQTAPVEIVAPQTNETGAALVVIEAPPIVAQAPPVETQAPEAPPRKAPQIKLSARQRTNVDQFDNGARTSAGAINSVLLSATRPMTRDEITNAALAFAPERFDKLKAPGRVQNHLRHLLVRALVENVGGAWRVRPDARAMLNNS